MLTQIQRQIRRHPTAGVVVTLFLWWTVTSFIAFSLRSNWDSDSGVSEELSHLGRGGEEVLSLRHREQARTRKVSRKTRHNKENGRSTRRHSSLQAIEKPKDTVNNLHTEKELRSEHENLEAYVIPTESRKRYVFADKQKFKQESLLNFNVKNNSENGGSFEGSRRHLLSKTDSDSNSLSAVSHDSASKDDVLTKFEKHYLEKGNIEPVFDKTFVATVCESSQPPHSYHISISSQMDHMKIMLKSLVISSKSAFKVILVTDTQDIYDLVLNQLKDWPARYRSRLLFQRAVAWSPLFESNFQEERRSSCQWSKLFLVESLPHEQDVVIYIDQNTVFVAPAEYMWEVQMEPLDQKRIGYSSVVAENDAPVVMNLTTLRAFIGPHGNFTLTALHFIKTRPKLDGRGKSYLKGGNYKEENTL
nr:uncharacterized protein LOC123749674 [Procambarus clarkii]